MEEDELLDKFKSIYSSENGQLLFRPLLENVLKDSNPEAHFSITLDSHWLLEENILLGHLMLRSPVLLLDVFSKSLVIEQERIYQRIIDENRPYAVTVKPHIHGRLQWLPAAHRKPNVSSIRSADVGTFLQFSGTVIRNGTLKVLEAMRVFECNNPKCTHKIKVFAALNEVGSIIQKPQGPCPGCRSSSSYNELPQEKVCHDYQEVKVQEQVQRLGVGSMPRAILVLLQHDLVGKCKAGDDVVITGIPLHRWSTTYANERCSLETVIQANTVHLLNSARSVGGSGLLTDDLKKEFIAFWRFWTETIRRPLIGRNLIIGSICPQVHGLFVAKLAVLLTLIGSPSFIDTTSTNGSRIRGESHLLLVGDPGTGKSQLLKYAALLSPRSILTTGVGTTSAGLTCACVRDGSEFQLEAGALVLADRGLCCIDEFSSIREQDRATIHEAMEQQTLSVAKAGLVTTLNTRTTIIAATNPKGKYDIDTELSTNTGIATPLLSRFDLVLVLLDNPDPTWDLSVSEFILNAKRLGGKILPDGGARAIKSAHQVIAELPIPSVGSSSSSLGSSSSALKSVKSTSMKSNENDYKLINEGPSAKRIRNSQSSSCGNDTNDKHVELFSLERLQSFLSYCQQFEPELGNPASFVLQEYYKLQRKNDSGKDSGRTTLRLLESLIRVSKAHARLMCRSEVIVADALVAISLIDRSMNITSALDSGSNTLQADFPDDPEKELFESGTKLLNQLGLQHLDIFEGLSSSQNDPYSRFPSEPKSKLPCNDIFTPLDFSGTCF